MPTASGGGFGDRALYRPGAGALALVAAQPEEILLVPSHGQISKREKSVCHLVRLGLSNREIAKQVGTTEQVVKNTLRRLYRVFNVNRVLLAIEVYKAEMEKQRKQRAHSP